MTKNKITSLLMGLFIVLVVTLIFTARIADPYALISIALTTVMVGIFLILLITEEDD